MTIGQLYSVNNVLVGQAACLVAPANTAIPNIALTALVSGTVDPFDITPWVYAQVKASATISAGTFTLAYTLNGVTYTTTAITYNAVASAYDSALTTALAPLGITASDIIVTGGPASATATPINIAFTEPFTGGTWVLTPTGITGGTLSISPPLWTPVGATDQGWKWASNKSTTDIQIEEQSAPVARTMDSQIVTVEGALSEDISRTLALAYNMTTAFTANGAGTAGYETLAMTDTILQYAVALIMQNNLGFCRWLYIPAATCLGNADGTFRRAAAKRMYNAVFSSNCPITSIIMQNVLLRGT